MVGSEVGLVGQVSVCCGWVRQPVGCAASVKTGGCTGVAAGGCTGVAAGGCTGVSAGPSLRYTLCYWHVHPVPDQGRVSCRPMTVK